MVMIESAASTCSGCQVLLLDATQSLNSCEKGMSLGASQKAGAPLLLLLLLAAAASRALSLVIFDISWLVQLM